MRYNRYAGTEFIGRAALVFPGYCCRYYYYTTGAVYQKQLDGIPQEAGQQVTVDLHQARYVDHTVIENLHNYERDFKLAGGDFHVINLDEHKPMSEHPLAARRKIIA